MSNIRYYRWMVKQINETANAILLLMNTVLLLLTLGAACELLVHCIPSKATFSRSVLAYAAIYSVLYVTVLQVLGFRNALYMLAPLALYRIISLIRITKHRLQADYLRRVTLRTSIWLVAISYGLCACWKLLDTTHIPYRVTETIIISLLLAAAVIGFAAVLHHMRKMWHVSDMPGRHDSNVPTVTVAIPARNETDDLEACLQSVLASQYPKMEVIVLDDCSQSSRTTEIIRNFAHDGVRFIQGSEPKPGWLAKNQAYERLAAEASGQIILFAGVDVRFEPHAISRLVQYMQAKNKSMLSVLPKNIIHGSLPLIQPMRYMWELALPRKAIDKPPVLSTCWLITAEALGKSGSLKAVPHSIIPERHFAKQLASHDEYSFIASGDNYRISSVKSPKEQRATAVRTMYPMMHQRMELVAMLSLCFIAWVGIPVTLLVQYWDGYVGFVPACLAVLSMIINLGMYALVLRLAYGWVGIKYVCSLPLAALVYVGLLNYSMFKYEFSKVVWKDRIVSFPVMHVIPKLPDF